MPTPGVDYSAIQRCIDVVQDNSVYALINLFSGGALLQLSVFALGIMPYITASIILQLLTVVIPRLETLKADGHAGQADDHAVHPIRDHRAGDPAVDGDPVAGTYSWGPVQRLQREHHPRTSRSGSSW